MTEETSSPKKSSKKSKKTLARADHPLIEAVVGQLFRFEDAVQAKSRLNGFQEIFVISKDQDESGDTLKLWVKGYKVTEEQKEEGYLGNFILIKSGVLPDGKHTLYAEDLEVELKIHPQKKRPPQRHPNWGHPILRAVKGKKIFPTIEAAQEMLQDLHEEFPEATIPNPGKLYVMIYSRAEDPKNPIKKWVFEIKVQKEGGFFIDFFENEYKQKEPLPGDLGKKKTQAPAAEAPEDDKKPAGYFTSMVELKRNKKRK